MGKCLANVLHVRLAAMPSSAEGCGGRQRPLKADPAGVVAADGVLWQGMIVLRLGRF